MLLTCGDRAGYRELRKQMLQRFRNTTNPLDAERTVVACLMSPEPLEDRGQLARLAAFAVQREGAGPFQCYFLFARGLSDYRQGRYVTALEWFARSRQVNARLQNPSADLNAKNGLFEAMALHRLGRTEEATRLLATTAAAVQKAFDVDWGTPGWDWHGWLYCRVAAKEAKAVLEGKPKPGRD